MQTASKSIKEKNCLHTPYIELYSGIARFPCDSMVFLAEWLGDGRNLLCIARDVLPIRFFRYFNRMT